MTIDDQIEGSRSATVIDREIGERIRMQRTLRAMSQETLADKVGLAFQQIQKYEKAKNRVPASRLLDIAKALRVSVGTLLPGADSVEEPRQAATVRTLLSDRTGAEMITSYMALPINQRRAVTQLITAMAESGKIPVAAE